jgi:hypothetical protein
MKQNKGAEFKKFCKQKDVGLSVGFVRAGYKLPVFLNWSWRIERGRLFLCK